MCTLNTLTWPDLRDGRKEMFLFNDALNTFYLRLYGVPEGRKCFYLTTHSSHFIYGYIASDIWLRTILIVRKETRCRHIGYSFRLTARVLLYAPSHRQDSTYHGLCYTSRGALAGTRNSSIRSPHEGSTRRPIAPWANALTTELHLAPRPAWHWVRITVLHCFFFSTRAPNQGSGGDVSPFLDNIILIN